MLTIHCGVVRPTLIRWKKYTVRFLLRMLQLMKCPILFVSQKRLTYHFLVMEVKLSCYHSLIENAVKISHGKVNGYDIGQIVEVSKELLRLPGHPFDGVKITLAKLRDTGRYRMIVFTKGELLDQENKFRRSGLRPYFDDIVIVSEKTPDAYIRLCKQFGVKTGQLLTVGDSYTEDVAPVLKIGGWAVHIPNYMDDKDTNYLHKIHPCLLRLSRFAELANFLCPNPRLMDESKLS